MSRGRPRKLTPELVAALARELPRVCFIGPCAHLMGVSRSSLLGWLASARKLRADGGPAEGPDGPIPPDGPLLLELLDAYEKALAETRASALASVRDAFAGGDWRAATWLLASRWPDEWGSARSELKQMREQVAEMQKLLADLAAEAAARRR